jgi:chromate transporter
MNQAAAKTVSLAELAKLFLYLGVVGFGGPAAHIALMKEEVVTRRGWLNEQGFLDLLGATNLIPGPNSTELAIHIGREKAGWRGLLVAGFCFIMPAVLMTVGLAWLYVHYGSLPQVEPFLIGIKPAIIAVIIAAILPLAKKSAKSEFLLMLGMLALVLCTIGIPEVAVIFGSGLLATLFYWRKSGLGVLVAPAFISLLQTGQLFSVQPGSFRVFLIFLKIGAIIYGSGYVLFAYLDGELVATGLLSEQQLTDAITVGQLTPGPVFSAVSFVGYLMDGWVGAAYATIGIFLPSFLFVAMLNPLVGRMRKSRLFSSFLDAVNIAAVAAIASMCWSMIVSSVADWRTALIGLASLTLLLIFKRINSALVILGGSLTGYLLHLI